MTERELADIAAPLRQRFIARTQEILDSYRRHLGHDLIARSGDVEDEAARLFAAPFVVLSHGTEPDPVLNYGNALALQLWEMSADALTRMPSRLTAEPMTHAARESALQQTRAQGFATGYVGVRISATGRRFTIENATLWNVLDASGRPAGQPNGQAATFARWTYL